MTSNAADTTAPPRTPDADDAPEVDAPTTVQVPLPGEQPLTSEPTPEDAISEPLEELQPLDLHAVPRPLSGWLLAIDSSSHMASLALAQVDGDGFTGAGGELVWPVGREGTVMLLAQVDHLLTICGCSPSDLAGVVVTTGPGGFNALRVGMSVAKGLAFANDLPLFGVPTLDVAARAVAGWGMPVRAFNAAGRNRVVYTDYHPVGGVLTQVGDYAHRITADLAADLNAPTILAGDLIAADAAVLRSNPHVVLPDQALRRRRAAFALDIALPRWLQGQADDLATLEPLYLHTARTDDGGNAGGQGSRGRGGASER